MEGDGTMNTPDHQTTDGDNKNSNETIELKHEVKHEDLVATENIVTPMETDQEEQEPKETDEQDDKVSLDDIKKTVNEFVESEENLEIKEEPKEMQEAMSEDKIKIEVDDADVTNKIIEDDVCMKSVEKDHESEPNEIIMKESTDINKENDKCSESASVPTNIEKVKPNEESDKGVVDENKLSVNDDVDMDIGEKINNDEVEKKNSNDELDLGIKETNNDKLEDEDVDDKVVDKLINQDADMNKDVPQNLPNIEKKITQSTKININSDHDNYKQGTLEEKGDKPINTPNLYDTAKDEIENALSALAAAAIDHGKDTDTKSQPAEPKEKEVWHTVGFIKGTSFNVQNYFYLEDVNQNLTEDQLPDVGLLNRINLESGTAYKFRVAAINSVGRSDWSEVSAFKTCVPGFPSAPSAIRIAKSVDGAHISWEPPKGEITEYSVYLAVQNCTKEAITPASMAFVRVYCGAKNSCVVAHSSLASAYVDTTTKSAIIFRIAARNEKGYGPATQVRWLQDSGNRAVKRPTEDGQAGLKKTKSD